MAYLFFDATSITTHTLAFLSTSFIAKYKASSDTVHIFPVAYNQSALALITYAEEAKRGNNYSTSFNAYRQELQALLSPLQDNKRAYIDTIIALLEKKLRGISLIRQVSDTTIYFLKEVSQVLSAMIFSATLEQSSIPHTLIQLDESTSLTHRAPTDTPPHTRSTNDNIIIYSVPVEKNTQHIQEMDEYAIHHFLSTTEKEFTIISARQMLATANPRWVKQFYTIPHTSYETALEISYLGGKLLHPNSMNKILTTSRSISFINVSQSSFPTIQQQKIHSQESPRTSCYPFVCIVDWHGFSVLYMRQPSMFQQYGFLAQLFSICSTHRVCVETISTSDISVTFTAKTKDIHSDFLQALQTLGHLTHTPQQSIISVIASEPLKHAKYITSVVSAIPESVEVTMSSFGKGGKNYSFVINDEDVADTVQSLHARLFENKTSRFS